MFVVSKHIFDVSDANMTEQYFCVASRVIHRTVTDIQIISCTNHSSISIIHATGNVWLVHEIIWMSVTVL
jgi:hypothetical protein